MLRAQLLLAKRVSVAAGRSSLHSSAVSRMAADADAAGAEKVVLTLSAVSFSALKSIVRSMLG